MATGPKTVLHRPDRLSLRQPICPRSTGTQPATNSTQLHAKLDCKPDELTNLCAWADGIEQCCPGNKASALVRRDSLPVGPVYSTITTTSQPDVALGTGTAHKHAHIYAGTQKERHLWVHRGVQAVSSLIMSTMETSECGCAWLWRYVSIGLSLWRSRVRVDELRLGDAAYRCNFVGSNGADDRNHICVLLYRAVSQKLMKPGGRHFGAQ
ncbi:unnamed protein product [Protopolystoma xenopodis]|uniref:Uncharacterized protein n=1 Tax=Protopolystoma xenopodis TaxID=117903 RepID=A0A3S5CRR7_9PLAT|nr:unnamed protein product [Protopolystoma xenopodis]